MSNGSTTVSLAEVLTLNRSGFWGQSPPGDQGRLPVRVIRNGDVTREGTLRGFAERSFSPREAEVSQLLQGDIALTTSGDVGKAWLVDAPGYSASNFVRILRPDTAKVLPPFLRYALESESVADALRAHTAGTTIQNLQKSFFNDARVALPPIADQQRLVGILDEAFEGIARAEANAEKNLQNARALFDGALQSIFADRNQEWVERKLDEVSWTFGRGRSRHRPRNDPRLYGGDYPFIQTGDVRNTEHVIESYTQTYSEQGLAQSKLWPAGTVCVTIAANIAESAILGFDACFPDSIVGVVVDDAITSNSFLLYLLRSFKARLQAQGKGSAQDNINIGTFDTQRFPFPPLDVQRRIVTQLDGLRAETGRLASLYRDKLVTLDGLRKSLLHQAFSGQL